MREPASFVFKHVSNVASIAAAAACAALLLICAAPVRPGLARGKGLRLDTTAFRADGFVPARYTCSGENISPALRWDGAPPGTKSFAVIVTDPDAPGGTWVHWVAYNLPPEARSLPERVPRGDEIRGGGSQGMNDFRFTGYGGPCPPPGNPHRYFFRLYALNARLALKAGATRGEVENAMKGHILAQAVVVGRYGR